MKKTAEISKCGKYRYVLTRTWDENLPPLIVIGLNPSTADADKDDATIRKLLGFARRLGRGGLVMLNLFAFRSTDPRALVSAPDPVGPRNLETLWSYCAGKEVVAAWGAFPFSRGQAVGISTGFRRLGTTLVCFGANNDGSPKHPLYLPNDTALRPFPGAL